LREILNEVNVTDATERLLQFTIHAPMLVGNYWALRLEMSENLREKISLLSQQQRTELELQALESIREYSTDGGINFPAEVLIVSGAKSRFSEPLPD
jgi:hypothetical protein